MLTDKDKKVGKWIKHSSGEVFQITNTLCYGRHLLILYVLGMRTKSEIGLLPDDLQEYFPYEC